MIKNLLLFIISGSISALAMLFLDLEIPHTFFVLLIPPLAFFTAYSIRFHIPVRSYRFRLTGILMLVLWAIAFAVSFNMAFMVIVPISGLIASYGIRFIGKKWNGIILEIENWVIGIGGFVASGAGVGVFFVIKDYYQGDLWSSVAITCAAIVGLWQYTMGIILLYARDDDSFTEEISRIGNE